MGNTLVFAGQTISDDHIFGGVSYLADLNTSEEFTIGNTASASISFVTDIRLPIYTKDPENGTSTWTQGTDELADSNSDLLVDENNNSFVIETPRGRFYITEVTKSEGFYTVTAYDAMILLETNISALSLTFPLTVSAAASAIAAYIGCTVSGTVNNGTLSVTELNEDMTIRQLLGYVAEASGCSVKVDGSGHLCFMYYDDSGITLTPSDYKKVEIADYVCAAIDNVTILNSVGAAIATAGSGTNTLYIEANPFLEEATNTEAALILSLVESFEYAPLTCDLFDADDIEIGTIVTFDETPTLVMHLESGEDGAVASSVGSDSRAEYNKSFETMLAAVSKEALDAADEASTKATKYITKIDNAGIKIHAYDDSTDTPDDANYAKVDGDGLEVYKGGYSVAKYGDDARIGKEDNTHIEMNYHSMRLVDRDGEPYFAISDLRNAQGNYEKVEQHVGYNMQVVISGVTYYAVGLEEYAESVISVSVDGVSKSSPSDYILYNDTVYGNSLICLTANPGYTANIVVDYYVDSEALKAFTIGTRESESDVGFYSFAEGFKVQASGKHSHAQNIGTKAVGFAQTVIGRYNAESYDAFVIGNGSESDDESNALTVSWAGNINMALDTTAASGVDHDLYTAIVALNWQNYVIV